MRSPPTRRLLASPGSTSIVSPSQSPTVMGNRGSRATEAAGSPDTAQRSVHRPCPRPPTRTRANAITIATVRDMRADQFGEGFSGRGRFHQVLVLHVGAAIDVAP